MTPGPRRMPIGLILLVPLLSAAAWYAFTGQHEVPDPEATATATAVPPDYVATWVVEATASPSAVADGAPFPPSPPTAPTPTPVLAHGLFRDGAWVRVKTDDGSCLNVRAGAALPTAPEANWILECLPDGFEGYLVGPAEERDGHWWWQIAGAGWVVEDYLQYVGEVSLRDARAPQFAGLGQIAFVRDGALWVMDASGGAQRILVPPPSDNPEVRRTTFFHHIQWSPDGTRISFNRIVPAFYDADGDLKDGGQTDAMVVDLAGTVLLRVPDGVIANWAPDGGAIGVIATSQGGQTIGGWSGRGGWLDLATGGLHLFSDADRVYQDVPSFAPDGQRLVVADSRIATADVPGDEALRIVDRSGAELWRLPNGNNVWRSTPAWSPDGTRIAFYEGRGSGQGPSENAYVAYDLGSDSTLARFPTPPNWPYFGGRCGGGEMFRTEWLRDGHAILFHANTADTGANGVYAGDVSTGKTTLIELGTPLAPSPGPGSLVVIPTSVQYVPGVSRDGFIFVGDLARGGRPVLITDGTSPVWSPVPAAPTELTPVPANPTPAVASPSPEPSATTVATSPTATAFPFGR